MDATTTNFDDLSDDYKILLLEFIDNIDLEDKNLSLEYGVALQKKIAFFYESLLEKLSSNKLKSIGDDLNRLHNILKSYNNTIENKSILKRLGIDNQKKHLENIITAYTKLEKDFDLILKRLQSKKIELLKDVSVLDSIYKYSEQYLKEFSLYIIAGEQKIKQQNNNENITRFQKKLDDLKITRTINSQMMPLIIMIQNNNIILIERISTITKELPIWRNHMLIALSEAIKSEKQNINLLNIKTISEDFSKNIHEVITIQQKSLEIIEDVKNRIN